MAAPSMASIDPTAPRTRPMTVLLPGLSRTGTNSMATALRILGHSPVWHGYEMAVSGNFQSQHWLKLLNKKYKHKQLVTRADFEPILNGYVAVSDFLCCLFAEELMDAYPEAKIVLVEREPEAWYRSFTTIMLDVHFAWPCLYFVQYLEWAVPNKNLGVMHLGFLEFFRADDGDEVRSRAIARYKEYYAGIRLKAKMDKRPLLEYKLGDAWEPLCTFLGKDVPVVDFPRVNEGDGAKDAVSNAARMLSIWALTRILGPLAALTIVPAVGWIVYRSMSE